MANVKNETTNQSKEIGLLRFAGRSSETNSAAPYGSQVCIANIGRKERSRRLRFGLFSIGAGLVIGAAMIALHLNPLWRLLLFFPFVAGASGYFQYADNTWVNLASRGSRNMDNGIEKIEDDAVLKQVRWQARRVTLKSWVAAAVLTLVMVVLPL